MVIASCTHIPPWAAINSCNRLLVLVRILSSYLDLYFKLFVYFSLFKFSQ
jgi:hypothetical protein